MKLTVTGRHLKITDAIQEHLDAQVDRHMRPWLKGPGDIHFALAVEKQRHFAEVTVKSKGYSVHAENETGDLYAAIDGAILKAEKQLKKHKERAASLKSKQNHKVNEKTI